jgi:hypothetical protein
MTKSKIQNPKALPLRPRRPFGILNFGFWICFGFRISCFGFVLLPLTAARAQFQADCWGRQQQQQPVRLQRDPLVLQHDQALQDLLTRVKQLEGGLSAAKTERDQLAGSLGGAGQELARLKQLIQGVQQSGNNSGNNPAQLLQNLQQLQQQHGQLSQLVTDLKAQLHDQAGQVLGQQGDLAGIKNQINQVLQRDLPIVKTQLGQLATDFPAVAAVVKSAVAGGAPGLAGTAAALGPLASLGPLAGSLVLGGAATGGLGVPVVLAGWLVNMLIRRGIQRQTNPTGGPGPAAQPAGPSFP